MEPKMTKALRELHGMSRTKVYQTWKNMKSRCHNPNHHLYEYYGGRGIKVCSTWHKFTNFYKDMGDRPDGLEIGRIDNNKGYNSNNCRWETKSQNASNRRKRKNSTSKHKFVYYDKVHNKWLAAVPFSTEQNAAGAVKVLMHFRNVVEKS